MTLTIQPPVADASIISEIRHYGPQDNGEFSDGIELTMAGVNWSNDSLLSPIRPGTIYFVGAGEYLPEPLEGIQVTKDSLVFQPLDGAERLEKLFRQYNTPYPHAIIYDNIKVLWSGNEIDDTSGTPQSVREWRYKKIPSPKLPEDGALRFIPDGDSFGIKVLSKDGNYMDPVWMYKFFQHYQMDANAPFGFGLSVELGAGFQDFTASLTDNLIIELRDEWGNIYQDSITVTKDGTSTDITPHNGIIRIAGDKLDEGTYTLDYKNSHRVASQYEGSPIQEITLTSDRLTCYYLMQIIDFSKWFVVEEFGHLYTPDNEATFFTESAKYFARAYELLTAPFDYVFFTNWRLDYDFDLLEIPANTPPDQFAVRPSTIGHVLDQDGNRKKVFGILWNQKNPSGEDFVYKKEKWVNDNAFIALNADIKYEEVIGFGWRRYIRVLQDTRGSASPDVVLSHHQKTLIIQRGNDLTAFCGGLDLAFQRWDTKGHTRKSSNRRLPNPLSHNRSPDFTAGDRKPQRTIPQTLQPWHDVHVEIKGLAALDIDANFRDRWNDAPVDLLDDILMQNLGHQIDLLNGRSAHNRTFHKAALPNSLTSVESQGQMAVKIARTYNTKSIFTLMQNIIHCIRRAERLIYIEDQYLISLHVAKVLNQCLSDKENLVVIIVTGEQSDLPGAITRRNRFLDTLGYDTFGDRVGVYHLRNKSEKDPNQKERGIYVHTKLVMVDDIWVSISSCNLNNRSFTADTEIGAMIIDGELQHGRRKFAFELRRQLWKQHLGIVTPADLLNDTEAKLLWDKTADPKDLNSQVVPLYINTKTEPSEPLPFGLADGIVDPWRGGAGVPDPDNPGSPFTKK